MVHKFEIEEVTPSTSRLRSIASQFISCISPYLLLLDLGMALSFVTIALPDLLNSTEGLSLNETQASWFKIESQGFTEDDSTKFHVGVIYVVISIFVMFVGSLSYLTQPLGAVMSGPLVDFFGRKKANFLVNIPMIIAWTLMYFAWNVVSLFTASALIGLSIGVMEAPINSYVGEISEPSLRGALSTTTQFFSSLGIFIMFFLGTMVTWRQAALLCLIAPVSSMCLVLLVPETPVWLLVRGREKDALKSLCYLRGWTTPENVKKEFDELMVYSKKLQICVICYNTGDEKIQECPHKKMNFLTRFFLKFKHVILCKETLRPLSLLVLYFTFFVMSGLAPVKPNMVNVSGALGMPVEGKTVVLIVGIISFVTSLLVIGFIKILGKRKIAITALLGTAICCVVISAYARKNLDSSVFSYDVETFPKETSYVPMIAFCLMTTFNGFGIPWVLLGEVFPFRSRASAQGFAAAANYVITFLAAKTLIDLEKAFQLWGAFAIYATFGFLGSLYLYFFLPETEGKSLQEIETFYNAELRTFANDPFINFFKRSRSKKSTITS